MGILYIIATPIGNLDDISFRALKTLKSVDKIICEDTRVSRKLLAHFEIQKPLESFHAHTNPQKIKKIILEIKQGKNFALISDAGTPTVSDPGSALIEAAWEDKIKIVPIPGPSAITTAFSISGFSDKNFLFLGYIPKKKGREKFLRTLAESPYPIVFFESPYRIERLVEQIKNHLDLDRKLLIARELTKIYETIFRGKIKDLELSKLGKIKGEFTIVIDKK